MQEKNWNEVQMSPSDIRPEGNKHLILLLFFFAGWGGGRLHDVLITWLQGHPFQLQPMLGNAFP